jgi:hypothetical protein
MIEGGLAVSDVRANYEREGEPYIGRWGWRVLVRPGILARSVSPPLNNSLWINAMRRDTSDGLHLTPAFFLLLLFFSFLMLSQHRVPELTLNYLAARSFRS